ncbi:MAG: TldD/PmbA family protein [Paludibacteraceae bacterium]
MITNENKNLAKWAMDYALKNGCQASKISLYSDSTTSFDLRDGKMDKLQQASESGMTIYLYVDGRYGTYSTNRLDKNELEKFIRTGIEATRFLAKDEYQSLPDASRFYKGGKPDLQLLDPKFETLQPDDKIDLAKAIADEVMGKDSRIISMDSSYSDGESFSYLLTSNGFEGESKTTFYGLNSGVSIKGEGDARPSDGWYESAVYFDDLIKKGIGQKGLERVLKKIGQKKVKSGKYTMIVDQLNSGRMLSPLINAIYGSSLQQKKSFLLGKLGEKIGSTKFTLIDEPHILKARGSRYFDAEGVATERRPVFENGVLKTCFIDNYNAKKMNMAPTISSPSLLVMETGDKDLNGLVAEIDNGILVTGFNGGNSNSSTGDFSFGIEGFLVENGKMTTPVSGMNVTGNMIKLWISLVETGNDPRLTSSWRIPSLVFEGVDFSGL